MTTPSPAGAVTFSPDNDGRIATILINLENPHHTFPPELLIELEQTLQLAVSAQVVILRTNNKITRSAIPEAFVGPAARDTWHRWIPIGPRVFEQIMNMPQPTIAVVEGLSIGSGADLALACDLRIATSGAHVGTCDVGLGTISGFRGSHRLAELIGAEQAGRTLRSTRRLNATTAVASGLFTSTAPIAELDHHLDQLIHRLIGPHSSDA